MSAQRGGARPVEPGCTAVISPKVAAAYRSGAKTVDQLLTELADQFVEDAKAIDPTIIGAWLGRDLIARNRDPGGAVQSVYLERTHATLRSSDRKAGVR